MNKITKNKYNIFYFDIAAFLITAVCVFFSMGWAFFRFITYAGKKDDKAARNNRKKWFELKHRKINHPKHKFEEEYLETRFWCENQHMKDCYIKSRDGLRLHAYYLPAENAKRTIVLSHGYKGSCFGSMAHMAKFLHENNSNILFIDQRCCGKSEGKYITFGAKEQYDVLDWVRYLNDEKTPDRNGKETLAILPIYLYGQSMGATTVILTSGHNLPENVKGIIADCGFHSMKQQLRDIASGWFHLHWIELLLMRVDVCCQLFAGFNMKETDTTQALKTNKLPMLFFHGEADTYVWPQNSRRNYEICRAPKKLIIIPGARHLCSSFTEPEQYKTELMSFFHGIEV